MFYPLLASAKLNLILIAIKPITNSSIAHVFNADIFETLYNKIQMIILIKLQITLSSGEDNPLPGGFANGVGK